MIWLGFYFHFQLLFVENEIDSLIADTVPSIHTHTRTRAAPIICQNRERWQCLSRSVTNKWLSTAVYRCLCTWIGHEGIVTANRIRHTRKKKWEKQFGSARRTRRVLEIYIPHFGSNQMDPNTRNEIESHAHSHWHTLTRLFFVLLDSTSLTIEFFYQFFEAQKNHYTQNTEFTAHTQSTHTQDALNRVNITQAVSWSLHVLSLHTEHARTNRKTILLSVWILYSNFFFLRSYLFFCILHLLWLMWIYCSKPIKKYADFSSLCETRVGFVLSILHKIRNRTQNVNSRFFPDKRIRGMETWKPIKIKSSFVEFHLKLMCICTMSEKNVYIEIRSSKNKRNSV